MLVILISMMFGGLSSGLISHQNLYCDCYRSNFEGKVCQDIKSDMSKGSCHE